MARWLSALARGDAALWGRFLGGVCALGAVVSLLLQYAGFDSKALLILAALGTLAFFVLSLVPSILSRRVEKAHTARPHFLNEGAILEFRAALEGLATAGAGTRSDRAREVLGNIQTLYCVRNVEPLIEPCALSGKDISEVLAAKVWPGGSVQERANALRLMAQTIRSELSVNTPHALVFDEDIIQRGHYRYVPAQYAELCAILALASSDKANPDVRIPLTLGAGSLIVCPELRVVIFLRRAQSKTMHPKKLHVFGGNLEPYLGNPGERYDKGLESCARRETQEESSFANMDKFGTMVLAHKERADESIQEVEAGGSDNWKRLMRNLPVHYCGVSVDKPTAERMLQFMSPEGRPEAIAVSELEARLSAVEDWVPAGWYTTVLWLWMGAPSQGVRALVGPRAARKMASRILGVSSKPA